MDFASKDLIINVLVKNLGLDEEGVCNLLNEPNFPKPNNDGQYNVSKVAEYCAAWNFKRRYGCDVRNII